MIDFPPRMAVIAAALSSVLAVSCIGTTASAASFDRNALIAGAKKEGALVLYTGLSPVAASSVLKAFHEKYPFIDVSNYYAAAAGALQARMTAENAAGKKVADVLSSGDLVQFHNLESSLATFDTPEQAAYGAGYKMDGLWTAYQVNTLGLAYNTDNLTPAQLPTSWQDLADPKYMGKLGLEDSTAGFSLIEWEALRKVLGDGYWPAVAKNKPVFFSSNQPLMEGLLRGELLINAVAGSYYIYQYNVLNGAPIEGIVPKEGVPVALSPVAVLKNAPHPDAARLFVDWALSAEGQTVMVEILGSYSARHDVPAPKGLPSFGGIKTLPPNPEDLIKDRAAFLSEWQSYERRK